MSEDQRRYHAAVMQIRQRAAHKNRIATDRAAKGIKHYHQAWGKQRLLDDMQRTYEKGRHEGDHKEIAERNLDFHLSHRPNKKPHE